MKINQHTYHVNCRYCGNSYDEARTTAPTKCGACGEKTWRPRLGQRVKISVCGVKTVGTVHSYEGSTLVAVDMLSPTTGAFVGRGRFDLRELKEAS